MVIIKNGGYILMKKFFEEFKAFAFRGNVMDLAIGVIIGAAFQGIVNSLVNDIISPVIGLVANTDMSDMCVTIGDVSVMYGSFLTAVINFLIMVFIIFTMMKGINKLMSIGKKEEKEAAPETKKCPKCMSEIHVKAVKCPHCTSDI